MGIYVSEINMPKGVGSKLVLQIFPDGGVYDAHGIRLGISNWAKAVPVPPHGDLIDRKQLIKPDHQHYEYMSDEFHITVRDVEAAPTIIPAEEGE